MGPVGPTEIANARRNWKQIEWGKRKADLILEDADWWLNKDDEFIYNLIPPENPRAISPSYKRGFPIHGGAESACRPILTKPTPPTVKSIRPSDEKRYR